MQFLYPILTWGFFLAAVPILVHLINMLRHRKVRWAAMEFLLESNRRNRRWVILKQWLLFASRVLAMILLVAMLAKWVSNSQWLNIFGGKTTHHYVLLDDSLSMSAVDQNQSAYQRSLSALSGLIRSISTRPGVHQLTLLRWSRASLATRGAENEARIDAAADFNGQSVPRDPSKLLERIYATEPTSLQLAPETPLELLSPNLLESNGDQAEVYLLTDLRATEFAEPEALRSQLRALSTANVGLHLIDCGSDANRNLSVTSVEPEQEVWAAGVPLMIRMQIKNNSSQVEKNVVLKVRTISYPEKLAAPQIDKAYSGDIAEVPQVVIDQIAPGESLTRQVQVLFSVPGQHIVEVSIPEDQLPGDNMRWCTLEIKPSQRVLLIDGSPDRTNSFYFETALLPDPKLRTGFSFDKEDSAYLRDANQATLNANDVIVLLDVPRLDDQSISKLETFTREGGGVFFLCGPNTNAQFVNERLYRDGEGLFPLEFQMLDEIESPVSGEPQVSATSHPILAPLKQLSSSPFFSLRINRYFIPTAESLKQSGLTTIAVGPKRTPFFVDKGFGQGRSIALTTGLDLQWSNWAQDPTFVVLALRTLGYLGSFKHPPTSELVGSDFEMTIVGSTLMPQADILFPQRNGPSKVRLQRDVTRVDDSVSKVVLPVTINSMDRDLVSAALQAGVFESWAITTEGENIPHVVARNAPPSEGDLTRIPTSELQRKMQGVPIKFRTADAVSSIGSSLQDSTHSSFFVTVLGLLLLAEQALAYSLGYHLPPAIGGSRQ